MAPIGLMVPKQSLPVDPADPDRTFRRAGSAADIEPTRSSRRSAARSMVTRRPCWLTEPEQLQIGVLQPEVQADASALQFAEILFALPMQDSIG